MNLLPRLLLMAALCAASCSPLLADGPARLAFEPVVNYFAKVTGMEPKRLHDRCAVFSEGETFGEDARVANIIVVLDEPPLFEVTFLVSGDFGMNYVDEFFEAPFFTRDECEKFHALLFGPVIKAKASFKRFTVEFTKVATPEWQFVSMSFGPLYPDRPKLP